MALTRLIFLVLLCAALPLLFFSRSEAGELGVSYGRVANNLPDPASVVKLLKSNGITMVRIYDADHDVLTSLANTGMKVMVMLPNENLASASSSYAYALDWAKSNVAAYHPSTQINGVAVGNEVFRSRPDLNSDLVPAMANVHKALAQLGLDDAVKVTTPLAFDALKASSPPSSGRFKDEIAQPVMKPMLSFLQQTGSYLSVNLYPCLTYMYQPDMNRDFALGNPNAPGVRYGDDTVYHSLLDAQLDAMHYAMDDLGFPSLKVSHTEHGCATGGRRKPGNPPGRRLGDDGGAAAPSVANAQAYINNLIIRVVSGKTGTPHRPDADMDVYIFALFNENLKGSGPDDIEANYGLFYPNMQKVYEFDFHGSGGQPSPGPPPTTPSWCVANAAVGNERLWEALNYSCANGADCSAIQRGAACFEPDTMVAHASYAFNDYYHRNNRVSGACDFKGAASIVYREPADRSIVIIKSNGVRGIRVTLVRKFRRGGTCDPNVSWYVANAGVGDKRLKDALDFACDHGADCSAIQPGAACYEPNTMVAHASYALNSYYQKMNRASGKCDFLGAGSVVYHQPSVGNCVLPSNG
ncbi:unnamed protein product [Urochloa decumbens]|uniref:X8 domain-containing protein n=1 Tax=Urochloa decumbens TaxID=240449 RepID=A0ABC9FYA8_9POAL